MLVFNPRKGDHQYGSRSFPARNYGAVSEAEAAEMRERNIRFLFEGDPDFPQPWLRQGTPDTKSRRDER
jgi:hypothetical protein